MRYINEMHEGEKIVEHYFCKQKQTLQSKTGKSYLSLKLQDKTGLADAKVWDINKDIQSFNEGEFIKIEAIVTFFNNAIQLKVTKARRSSEGEYDPSDYIPSTDKNIEDMFKNLLGFINTINSKYIKQLLEEIFIKNEKINKKFRTHSAAKAMHHSFRGGLLEHTLSVVTICDFLANHYKDVDRDVLIACAMLHDALKIDELSDFPENDYTDAGQLLGHLYMGAVLVGEVASKIEGFPKTLENLIKHCILSHHGILEFGAVKLPETMEAMLLHFADDMDAKIEMIGSMIKADTTSGVWVGWNRGLERNIRKSTYTTEGTHNEVN